MQRSAGQDAAMSAAAKRYTAKALWANVHNGLTGSAAAEIRGDRSGDDVLATRQVRALNVMAFSSMKPPGCLS
jgi:hypothetical protein